MTQQEPIDWHAIAKDLLWRQVVQDKNGNSRYYMVDTPGYEDRGCPPGSVLPFLDIQSWIHPCNYHSLTWNELYNWLGCDEPSHPEAETRIPNLHIIVNVTSDDIIGIDGDLAVKIPEDTEYFQRTTMGHTVIMGRKTYESLPHGALHGRRNIIVTGNPHASFPGCDVAFTLNKALEMSKDDDAVFIIGGESLYRRCIRRASVFHITRTDVRVPILDGHTYARFPTIALAGREWSKKQIISGTFGIIPFTITEYRYLPYQPKSSDIPQ